MKKLFFVFTILILSLSSVFATDEISDYCQRKIDEFVTLRVELKAQKDDQKVLAVIEDLENDVEQNLKDFAIDYEQEKQILSNLYFMESYVHLVTKENRAQMRKKMKNQMNDCLKIMEEHKTSELNKWFFVTTADVTSYYMTRSVLASFFWGFKVKDWHKKALEKDEYMASANACLGNWNFYAPAPIGSNRKARNYYKNGLKGARTPGEKYMVYTYYSQFLYEMKEKEECQKYLELAYSLNLGTAELDLMKKCNDEGISYLQYMRNLSGIDEEIPEEEKEIEDR